MLFKPRQSQQLVFLGTYTDHGVLPHWPHGTKEGDGLVVAAWCNEERRLIPLHTVPVLNPAFMKYHPRLNVLYVLSECIHEEGRLTAFSVDTATGALKQLGQPLAMTGKSTCYIAFDEDASHAVITNYWDAVLNVVELCARTGAPLRVVQSLQQGRRDSWRQVADREDHMSNRQDGPHAHCVVFDPTFRWAFVPDLGDNGVHQYAWREGRLRHEAFVPVADGDGPRHFVFHPRLPVAYSGCELRSQVQVFAVDASDPDAVKPRIRAVQRLSTLPDGFQERNYVGEIKIDKEGQHVYVSNRGHDSIATFRVDPSTGLLARAGVDAAGGRTPRHFGLAPCGRFAVVGAQDSDRVGVFEICPRSGRLAARRQELELASPNFVLFAPPPAPAAVTVSADATAVAVAALQAAGSADLGFVTGAERARERAMERAASGVGAAPAVAVAAN